MSTEKDKQSVKVKVKDLVDEAKKRIVFLITCVVGLSYLMSLTSSSVWVNLPAAAFVIILLRYFSVDFEMKRKAAAYNNSKSASLPTNIVLQKNPLESSSKVLTDNSDWRRKVNSPVVEDAIDHFTRHIVSEWVTDLWYSRITPDKQAPEELVHLINGVIGEISSRIKNINLIDLLTSDIINIFCTQLELFRTCQTKSEKLQMGSLSIEQRDIELKSVLAADNKLHPVLFSAESEHKVLQHIMEGLISFTFKPEDLHCSVFHFIVRELLACAVMRPVLNLANPRFVNERIENLVIARRNKADKGPNPTTQVASQSNSDGSSKVSSTYQISRSLDPSARGVELVHLKKDIPESNDNENENILSKDPLLSVDARSTRSWGSLPSGSPTSEQEGVQRHHSGGNGKEWGDMLDIVSRRKTETLAPEHFENVWAKGRNYKKKEASGRLTESSIQQTSSSAKIMEQSKGFSKNREKVGVAAKGNGRPSLDSKYNISALSKSDCTLLTSFDEDDEFIESGSNNSSYTSSEDEEEEDPTSVTGLDSPGIKVWDGKSNRNNSDTHIHHPLESFDKHKTRKTNKGRVKSQKVHRSQSAKQRSRLNNKKNVHVWQEVERTSFPLGHGQDILNSSLKGHVKSEESSGDSEGELFGRIYSGSTASSSLSSISVPEGHNFSANTPKISLMEDSFLTLRCEVLGANIVKSGSTTFAVYSISVMDIDNSSWSIKRRFRHFEELHRRLKEFPEYRLHLPPKHFLSTGLDVPVIQERCKLLDIYLKKLLQLPTISGSIEVWDFLSVDSQTYSFTNSISIIETLPVDLEGNSRAKQKDGGFHAGPVRSRRELINQESTKESMSPRNVENLMANGQMSNTKYIPFPPPRKPAKYRVKPLTDSGSDSDNSLKKKTISSETRILGTVPEDDDSSLHASPPGSHADSLSDPALPSEWVPPNLSAPILDLVDVIFLVQDGGWIRRKAFWVAKQVLQLGMGDAFDDWLIEKIQILRRGSIVASGINRLEQILWPDGIFLTKHPNRQRPNPNPNPTPPGQPLTPSSASQADEIQKPDEWQQKEAQRRAEFVYELMIDNAPATIVGLVGRKEYEQCAKDLYYFIQSAVCLKQLVFELLELLLSSAFPEMDYVFKQLHEEKHRFGEFQPQK